MSDGIDATAAAAHRANAVAASNSVWELLGRDELTTAEHQDLLRRAYAGGYHWHRASGQAPHNEPRAEYLIAKAHLRVARDLPAGDAVRRAHETVALDRARSCLAATSAAGLADFDLAYAHEVVARAAAAVGDTDTARTHWDQAVAVPIADDEDRALVRADLADPPV